MFERMNYLIFRMHFEYLTSLNIGLKFTDITSLTVLSVVYLQCWGLKCLFYKYHTHKGIDYVIKIEMEA